MLSVADALPSDAILPPTFEEYLSRFAKPVGEAIVSFVPCGSHPSMDTYLYDAFSSFVKRGGKRHRPLMCLAACLAVGGEASSALSGAAAIELFQAAALIHDDIADDSRLRRGSPCLHVEEGLGLALNAGDLGLVLSQQVVLADRALPDAVKVRMACELSEMALRTIEGQALDIGWCREGSFDISVSDYLCMASHKTAYYSGAVPLAVGAIAGSGSEAHVAALRSFGFDAGLAFQIHDDVLNLVGQDGRFDKDFRSDITEGKRTLVAVHALAHSERRERLLGILSSKERDPDILEEAVSIMEEAGSIVFARAHADGLVVRAKQTLRSGLPPSRARDVLVDMADWFVGRRK